MDRVTYWGETCSWTYLKFTEAKIPYFIEETPTFKRIIDCAFGTQQGAYLDTNEKVLKEQVQRLVKCMLDRQPIPRDIVHALTIKASTPIAYSHGNRERIISTACAVITKYYIDIGRVRKGEDEKMRLELDNHDRSYLFGRLLAVLEKVERATYDRGEAREPNAIRLQAAYVNHPFKTWMILEDALKPYFQKLNPGSREYYRRLITEITESFESGDQKVLNQGLKENYLLGYYLQRAELNRGHEDQKEVAKDE
jgi:CRISPR-associated protein Csd1